MSPSLDVTVTITRRQVRAWVGERARHEATQLVCESLYCFAVAAAEATVGELVEASAWTADAVRLAGLAVGLRVVVALWCFFDWVKEVTT